MKKHEIEPPLTHAKHESGEIKYVLDVPNGNACNCRCPICNEPLTAKHGNKDVNERGHIPHFAHLSETGMCKGAQMSIMHLKAQQIINERKFVMAPKYNRIKERRLLFVDVSIEEREEWQGIRPDVYGVTADGRKWAIEIYYTNKVDRIKEEKIYQQGVSCLEIDISRLSFDDLEKYILDSAEKSHWINNPNYDEIIREEDRLKQETDRLKIKEVVDILLKKSAFNLPEKSYIQSQIIYPDMRSIEYTSPNKLFTSVKLTVKEGKENQDYYICVGTRESISHYLQYEDQKATHIFNILELYIDDLYKSNEIITGDYNYKWRYNIEYEEKEKLRRHQRKELSYYYSRPDKWYVEMYGMPFSHKCEIKEDCKSCEICECILECDGSQYVICNKERKKAFEKTKNNVTIEKIHTQQHTPADSNIQETLLPFSSKGYGYSRPLTCDNIIQVNDYYLKTGVVIWKGGAEHVIDKQKISSDGKSLIVIHHDDSFNYSEYYITSFSNRKYDLLARTKKCTREEALTLFNEVR